MKFSTSLGFPDASHWRYEVSGVEDADRVKFRRGKRADLEDILRLATMSLLPEDAYKDRPFTQNTCDDKGKVFFQGPRLHIEDFHSATELKNAIVNLYHPVIRDALDTPPAKGDFGRIIYYALDFGTNADAEQECGFKGGIVGTVSIMLVTDNQDHFIAVASSKIPKEGNFGPFQVSRFH